MEIAPLSERAMVVKEHVLPGGQNSLIGDWKRMRFQPDGGFFWHVLQTGCSGISGRERTDLFLSGSFMLVAAMNP